MMDGIRSDSEKIGVTFDVFSSEKNLVESGKVDRALNKLKDKGLLYEGATEKPLGKDSDEWSPEPQLLFKSTKFGDDSDRVVVRADGNKTYFASDIAYHFDKFERGFKKQIDIWGADHGGYVKRMESAVIGMTDGAVDLDISLCQIVSLQKDGKPFRMSKRAGNFILITDILDEIEADVFRLFVLSRSVDIQMSFDLAKTKEQSRDNPIFYIQYAIGRINSVVSNYQNAFNNTPPTVVLPGAYGDANENEKALVRLMANYPSIVEHAAVTKSPHLIVSYLDALAQQFHSIWTLGVRSEEKFVDPTNKKASDRRMLLVLGLKNTLESGLGILGVSYNRLLERVKEKPSNR
jgi:arginyl-tRNA synthetase